MLVDSVASLEEFVLLENLQFETIGCFLAELLFVAQVILSVSMQ